ncbi:MAG: ABC transporter substrate binding protein [Sulfurisoma sp.]|nr:ABC transporter substrate binding protein [Sulfurisoma sp.]
MLYAFSGMARAAGPAVWVALSDAGGAYAEAAAAVEAEIERAGTGKGDAVARPWRELTAATTGGAPQLIIAVGGQALSGMLASGPRVPLLAVLVPEAAFQRAVAGFNDRPNSAVLLDQPPGRQLAALRLALPSLRRVGILFGPESRWQEASFQRAAAEVEAQLIVGRVSSPDGLAGVLQHTLNDSDLLLAVADSVVFNNASIQNILTAAYRQRVPLAAFSPAYVKAGALLAVYSTPAQVGRQAGEMARVFLSGRPLPPPQAPQDFVVGINAEVARSLGIPLATPDEHLLASQLKAMERKP